MIILLDPGHGRDTKGKGSPDALAGRMDSPLWFREWCWTREIAGRVHEVLLAEGLTSYLLVKEEIDIPLADRVSRANAYCRKYGKDNVLLVSIHNNAAGNGDVWCNARGWSIYTTRGVTEADRLARQIWWEAEKEFKFPLKVRRYASDPFGYDYESDLYILKHTFCPAVLIEHFFQDNKEDVKYLKSDAGKASCIQVIVQGIENYIAEVR